MMRCARRMMHTFDDLLVEINDFGKYQKTKYFLICLAGLIPSMTTYLGIFLAPVPDFKCSQKEYDLKTLGNYTNSTGEESIAVDDKCFYYSNNTFEKCSSWEYSKEYYQTSLTEEWNMVCDRSFLRSNVQSVYFVGYLVGSLILGNLSDKFGRRPIMLVSFLLILLGAIGSALGPQKKFGFLASYIIYCVSRFLMACGTRGINETGYVLALELAGKRKRVFSAIAFECFFSFGQLILVFTAFLVRDWRTLALTFAVAIVPFLSYVFLLPESPRWLISQKRENEALVIIENIAKTNKRQFDKKRWTDLFNQLNKKQQKKETIVTLIKSLIEYPKQSIVLITMLLNWIVNNFVFYGVGLKSNDLGINPYLSFTISAFVELIAYSFTFTVINRIGRKKIYFLFLFMAGSSCLSIVFVDNIIACVVLAMFGKFSIAASYAILRLYSNEVFPTSIRNSVMGLCSMFSRLGVIVTPFINSLGDTIFPSFPFLVFGIFGLIAAFSVFLLPETLNKELPESIQDARKLSIRIFKLNNSTRRKSRHVPDDLKEEEMCLETKA